jgi:hypothetical protein
MDIEKIEIALMSALSILKNEVDNIEFEELQSEYISAIEQIETALKEINKDE